MRRAVFILATAFVVAHPALLEAKVRPSEILQAIAAARRMEDAGATEQALEMYRNLANKYPQDRTVLDAYVIAFVKAQRLTEAIEFFEGLSSRFGTFWYYPLTLGRLYAETGDLDKARRYWKSALDSRVQDSAFYEELGYLQRQFRMCGEAGETYQVGREVVGRRDLYRIEVAEAYRECGEPGRSIDEALAALLDGPAAFDWVRGYLRQMARESSQAQERVLEGLRQCVSTETSAEPARLILVEVLIESGNLREAEGQLKAYGKSADDLRRLYAFGKELFAVGRFDLAEQAFARFVQGSKLSREYLDATMALGEIAEGRGEYARAESLYEEVSRIGGSAPETVTARLRLANIKRSVERDWESAKQIYASLIGSNHPSARGIEVSLEYADCYVALGDFKGALEQYGRLQAQAGKKEELIERIQFRVGETLFYECNFDSSRSVFLDVATEFPRGIHVNDALEKVLLIDESDSPETLGELSRALWLNFGGKVDSALVLLTSIVAGSENEAVIGTAALEETRVLNELGRASESLAILTAYLDEHPESRLAPSAQKALGDAYALFLGDREKAIEAYEKVVLNYPESVVALEVRKTLEAMRGIP